MSVLALVLFILTYCLMIALPKYRPWVALTSAALYVALGFVPLRALAGAVDWNVLLMLAGTMGTVSLFIETRMPNRMAEILLTKTPNVMWVAVAMCLFSGAVSAFVDNVATVLMLAPVGLAIAANLVGDTTSIMLGGYAGMDFLDFFFMDGRFSIFWAVELGALVTVPIILYLFRDQRSPVSIPDKTEVTNFVPTCLLLGTIVLLIAASFIPGKPAVTNGLICVGVFAVGALHSRLREKSWHNVKVALLEIDYQTLLLLSGLFIVIEGISRGGVIDAIAALFVRVGGSNLFIMYTIIVWGSVLISAFVDNIPYVATMLPVVTGIAGTMGCSPLLLYFGLLTGATLGGNITPIGASANITTIGILRRQGHEVSTKDFMRIGLPFTLAAVTTGYLFCWFVWH